MITIYFLVVSSLGIIAAVPHSVKKSAKENVSREIMQNISCPSFVTENSETNNVKALISVDETGKITLHEINAADPKLKEYVTGTLNEMKIKNTIPTGKFALVVNFLVV